MTQPQRGDPKEQRFGIVKRAFRKNRTGSIGRGLRRSHHTKRTRASAAPPTLSCPNGHPTDRCPYLAEAIDACLTTGRVPEAPAPES